MIIRKYFNEAKVLAKLAIATTKTNLYLNKASIWKYLNCDDHLEVN